MQVPAQYQGREQSYLKHRFLEEYLLAWGHKLGSLAQRRRVRLCYVDGFAGPWQAKDAALADTSIAIGLDALEAAATTWRDKGYPIDVDAYFVEKDPHAFASLERFIKGRTGLVRMQAFPGEFGKHVDTIRRFLGSDPGFIFVDPTGWKGAAMRFIAPLLADSRQRDVLVNVMFDHINRFKDDPRQFLREQMREFFGLDDRDMPAALGEEELFALYRHQLKMQCGVEYAADLAIPHPTVERSSPDVPQASRRHPRGRGGPPRAARRHACVKAAHALLTGEIKGPPAFAEYMRAYRFLIFFGIACVAENKYPALTRCWKELEELFKNDPAFEDGVFVQSWVLMDFPFGPERQTALDYFDEFLKEIKSQIENMVRDKLFYFIEETTPEAQFEAFMKLAGPYWMSCVTKNDAVPILEPDHYRTYLDRRA